jgi:hypothetical protein
MKNIYYIQKKIQTECTIFDTYKFEGQILRNVNYRLKIKGEIEWNKQ